MCVYIYKKGVQKKHHFFTLVYSFTVMQKKGNRKMVHRTYRYTDEDKKLLQDLQDSFTEYMTFFEKFSALNRLVVEILNSPDSKGERTVYDDGREYVTIKI